MKFIKNDSKLSEAELATDRSPLGDLILALVLRIDGMQPADHCQKSP